MSLTEVAVIGGDDPEYTINDFFYLYVFYSTEKGLVYKYHISKLPDIKEIVHDYFIKYPQNAIFFDDVLLQSGSLDGRSINFLSNFLNNKFHSKDKLVKENRLQESLDSLLI